jgi:hypothetical protein
MLKPSMLCLPLLLMGASCVPPSMGLRTAAGVGIDPQTGALPAAVFDHDIPIPAASRPFQSQVIAPGPPAKPFDGLNRSQENFQRSLKCLTAAVYYEARSESEEGQRAVAQVVLNRVRHPVFPNSVCGVVYQGSTRRTGCQFSFTCDGSMAARVDPWAWSAAGKVAEAALSGQVSENVGLATHYHTTAVNPWWAPSLTRAVTVGSHIFYRWRGNWGKPLAFRQRYAAIEAEDPAVSTPAAVTNTTIRVAGGEGVVVHRGPAPQVKAPAKSAALVKIHRASAVELVSAPPPMEVAASEPAPPTIPSAFGAPAVSSGN